MKRSVHLEILDQFGKLVTSGLGLVAALAWNNAILELFKRIFGPDQSNLAAMFGYAIIVTAIVVILSMRIGQAIEKIKESQQKEMSDAEKTSALPDRS